MTRPDAEKRILKLLAEIALVAKEYNEKTDYLHLTINLSDNYARVNNEYWEGGADELIPLDILTHKLIKEE